MLMDFVAWYCRGFTYMNVDVCIDAIWYGIAISSLRYCTFWQILGKCNNIPSILPRLPNCNTFLKGYYYIISVLLKIKKECKSNLQIVPTYKGCNPIYQSQYPSYMNVPLVTCWRYVKACYLPYASPLWNKKSNAIHQISCSKLQCLPYFKLLVNFSFGISSLTAIKIFADF